MLKNKAIIILAGILVLAAFFRFYRISEFMVFLGDEGRDVMVVKDILAGHFTLLGPRASAGDFFTGPIYYYMMAPFLWIFGLDPVGPAIMVALFSVATVFLIYYVGKKLFDLKTGLIAAALYAVAPLVIIYSRSSWNPNTVPFFSLLTIYLFYKAVVEKKSSKYFAIVGLLLGICVQLHYITLFLGAAIAVSLILINWNIDRKLHILKIFKQYLQIFAGFLIGFAPFLAFEARHNFQNFKAILSFVAKGSGEKGYATYDTFYQAVGDVFFRIFGRVAFNFPVPTAYKDYPLVNLQIYGAVIVLVAIVAIYFFVKNKNRNAVILLSTWLLLGTLLFGFYKKPIYDYYFVFLFPLPFFIIGHFFSKLLDLKKKWLFIKIAAGGLFAALFIYNIMGIPMKNPNNQKNQVKVIAEYVLSKTNNQPFNFGLITPGNSDHAYRYYFDILGHKPETIEIPAHDPDRHTVKDQLMVVCEDINCQPLGNPLYEIAGFGQASISGQWDISVVKIYRLTHFTEPKEK